MADLPKPGQVKPPFAPWGPPEGYGGPVDAATLDAIRAWLEQNPPRIGIGQIAGYQRMVSGYVGADGSIIAANPEGGFTAAKNSTGNYTVTFSRAFQLTPAVVASVNEAANYGFISPVNVTTSGFDVEIYNGLGVARDTRFSFFVQGS